mmetsp:Transcript_70867/g.165956  ORF Transcript_70867/g.165956 Transcript_70867/m.165956 type:complete len:249 (-) Transcript_70867:541-1287(-)
MFFLYSTKMNEKAVTLLPGVGVLPAVAGTANLSGKTKTGLTWLMFRVRPMYRMKPGVTKRMGGAPVVSWTMTCLQIVSRSTAARVMIWETCLSPSFFICSAASSAAWAAALLVARSKGDSKAYKASICAEALSLAAVSISWRWIATRTSFRTGISEFSRFTSKAPAPDIGAGVGIVVVIAWRCRSVMFSSAFSLREAASAAAEAEGDSKLPVPVSGHLFPKNQHGGLSQKVAGLGASQHMNLRVLLPS